MPIVAKIFYSIIIVLSLFFSSFFIEKIYAAGSTITIHAAGTPASGVYPTMHLLIDDTLIQTWTNIKGDPHNRIFQQFSVVSPTQVFPHQVKVSFSNDGGNGAEDRNVRIDKIVVDGTTIESESNSVYSVGSWNSATGCNGGYKASEWLHCNGYFIYGFQTPSKSFSLYDDELASGWVNWSWSSTVSFTSTQKPISGTKHITWTTVSPYAGLYLHTDTGIPTNGYTDISFSLSATQANQKFGIQLYNKNNATLAPSVDIADYGGTLTAGTYKTYTIPLSALGGVNTNIGGFHLQSLSGSSLTILVDAIQLKSSGTIPTPTATPQPTATPTPTPTVKPTVIPTATPTPTPTIVPTATPSPTPISNGSSITIHAAGTPVNGGYPTLQLLIQDTVVATWNEIKGNPANREFQTFTYNHASKASIGTIKVQFSNDTSSGNEDRNVMIDKIILDGTTYQSEAPTTFSMGSWNSANGCNEGFKQAEWLHCNGYFLYGQTTTPTPTQAGTTPIPTATPTPPSGTGYTVSNGKLFKGGTNITVKGINWYGAEHYPFVQGGLGQRNYKEMIGHMKQLGFNAVRMPFCTQTLKGVGVGGIDYGKNPDLSGLNSIQVMDKITAELNAQQMYVLFDFHNVDCQTLSDLWYNANVSEGQWIADLQFLAERYKSLEYFLGLDLKNEPHDSATWGAGNPATDWNKAAERAGSAVLSVNSNLLIFVEGIGDTHICSSAGGHWWGGNLEPLNCTPLSTTSIPANKLVLSPHVYGPDVYFSSYFNAPHFPQNLSQIWELHFGFATTKGYTLVIGEFGGKYGLQGGQPKDVTTQDTLVQYLTQKGICNSFWWSWNPTSSDTGGILQNDWYTPWPQKMTLLTNYYNNCK